MINYFKNLKANKKYITGIVVVALIISSILTMYLYLYPKLNDDALFDQNPILKDRWQNMSVGEIIDNEYSFFSDNSKLSSIVLMVQNLESDDNAKVRAVVYDKNNRKELGCIEQVIPANTQTMDLEIELDDKSNKQDVVIELENISNNGNDIKTRITDSENLNDSYLAYKIYSTMPKFIWNFVCVIIFLAALIIFIGFYVIYIKRLQCEKLFIIIALISGICYTMLFTPGTIPDESTHIRNTLGYSSIIMSKGTYENITIRESEQFIGDTQPSVKVLNSYLKMLIENNNSNTYIETGEVLSRDFSIISYLPGIIMVCVCRVLSVGGILTIYLARFFNYIVYTIAAYYAIKKMPICKNALFVMSLLPMVIHQCASLSYDTIIIASAWLVIAYGFHFVYGSNEIKISDIFIYICASCILVTQKTGIYFVLNLIPLLMNSNRISDKKARIKFKILTTLPWIVTLVGLPVITNNNRIGNTAANSNIVSWADREGYSISYFLANKKDTILLFLRTVYQKFDHYVFTTLGQYLGSLNLLLSKNIFILWLISVFVSCFKTNEDKLDVNISHKLFYLLSFLAVCGASMLAMAFAFTPVGWPTIEGVQGRYFLPVLIFLTIIVRNNKITLNQKWSNAFLLAIVFLGSVTIVNIIGTLLIV